MCAPEPTRPLPIAELRAVARTLRQYAEHGLQTGGIRTTGLFLEQAANLIEAAVDQNEWDESP